MAASATATTHALAVAVGFGTVILVDRSLVRELRRPLSASYVNALREAHRMIAAALAALWLTGAVLLGIRTGFDVGAFTPKLWTKLVVVVALTVMAVVVRCLVIPRLAQMVGMRVAEWPKRTRLGLAALGGLSMASWTLALVLGVADVLADARSATVAAVALVTYAALVGVSFAVVFNLQRLS